MATSSDFRRIQDPIQKPAKSLNQPILPKLPDSRSAPTEPPASLADQLAALHSDIVGLLGSVRVLVNSTATETDGREAERMKAVTLESVRDRLRWVVSLLRP